MITGGAIQILLYKQFKKASIIVLDESYSQVSPWFLKSILYVLKRCEQVFMHLKDIDCDDYSFYLLAINKIVHQLCFWNRTESHCVGVAIIDINKAFTHAINFYINKGNEVIFIEPQSGEIVKISPRSVLKMII